MNIEIAKKRLKSIRKAISQSRLDAMVVTKMPNVTYVTGFMGHDSWALVTGRGLYLLTDSRYTEQARGECFGCRIVERTGAMTAAVGKIFSGLRNINSVGVEDSVSVASFKALKKNVKAKVKPVSWIVEQVRRVKEDFEVSNIRLAGEIASDSLAASLVRLKPGITEIEFAGLVDLEIRRRGSFNSFDTIVAFGPNASRPHHQPGMTKLKKNDTVLIDFGAKYNGYCSDITRCFVIGKTTRAYARAYETVLASQAAAMANVRAGVSASRVDEAARGVIRDANLPVFGHGAGHGLGLEVHEVPSASPQSKEVLQAGEVITIEPGIYLPGKFGIRIEDDVLVTEKGCQVLTQAEK